SRLSDDPADRGPDEDGALEPEDDASQDTEAGPSGTQDQTQELTAAPQTQQTSPPAPRRLSAYALVYGSLHDGHVGLVLHEPTPDTVLDGLFGQVIDALGVEEDSADASSLRTQLRDVLSAEEVERNRPDVRSVQGHRITVRHGGRERTVDVRLAHGNGRVSAKYGENAVAFPDVQVERRAKGSQLSSATEGWGNVRNSSLPWTLVRLANGAGAVRLGDVTVAVSATHNQLAQSVTVGESLVITSKQRASDRAYPMDFDGLWQVRVDTPREGTGNWSPERSHGPVTLWVPEHRAFDDGTDPADLPEPADPDGLPLWGVESVGQPRRLLTELVEDPSFGSLSELDEGAERELEDFLAEEMLAGTPHLQASGGVYSPTLMDADGNAIGVLELRARIEPGQPTVKSPDGKFLLDTWFAHGTNTEQSAKFTSGLGVEGTGGPTFTTDHTPEHPNATASFGGNLLGKLGVNWQVNEGLTASGSAM
ncbi:hypothetical protein AB4Z54_21045, partial [Streptomyces sp. MCAF7]